MARPTKQMVDGRFRCSRCGAWKLPEDFHRSTSAATGRQSECRECTKVYQAAYKAANPERHRARERASSRARYAANPEKSRAYAAAWRAANSEKVRARSRAYTAANPDKIRAMNLRKNGWTQEAFEAALLAQGGKCANTGCDGRHSDSKRGLHADHDHATGLARVLLCHGCNTALGSLGEDSQRIAGLLELNDSFNERP